MRHLLVRCGDLPALPDGAIVDNDGVLAVLGERYPGGRCDFESSVTCLSMRLAPEARAARPVVRPVVRPAIAASPVVVPPEAHPVTAAQPVASRAVAPSAATPPRAPTPPRPRRPVPPPIFHPRPAPTPPAPHRPAAPPLAAPKPAPAPEPPAPEPTPLPAAPVSETVVAPSPEPAPPGPARHPTGAMSLDERKAQLRDLFRQADRPLGKAEIAAILGVNRDTPRHAINDLVAEGWLESTDTNPRSPVLRYRRLGE